MEGYGTGRTGDPGRLARRYVDEALRRSCLPRRARRRVRGDLLADIDAAMARGESLDAVRARMGDADALAASLYEGHAAPEASLGRPFREYRSRATLFGLPLVHIVRYGVRAAHRSEANPYLSVPTATGVLAIGPRARGIVAIGNLSGGVVAIGNLSAGVVSIGNIAAGALTLGNVALGALVGLGNMVVGALCGGNLAVGYAAVGNLAVGQYAAGNVAVGAHAAEFSWATFSDAMGALAAGTDVPGAVRAFLGWAQGVVEGIVGVVDNAWAMLGIALFFAAIVVALCRYVNARTRDAWVDGARAADD